MMSNNYLANLQRQYSKLDSLQGQLSGNRKFAHISDDPISFIYSQQSRYRLSRVDDYQGTIQTAEHWLTQAESDLMELNEIAQSAYETVISLATDVKTEQDRADVSHYIEQLRDHTLMELNSIFGDKYNAGVYNTVGSASSGGQKVPPFTVNAAGNLCFNGIDLTNPDDDPAIAADIEYILKEELTFDIGVGADAHMGVAVNGALAAIFTNPPMDIHDYDKNGNIIDKNGNVITAPHKHTPSRVYVPANPAGTGNYTVGENGDFVSAPNGDGDYTLLTRAVVKPSADAFVIGPDGTAHTMAAAISLGMVEEFTDANGDPVYNVVNSLASIWDPATAVDSAGNDIPIASVADISADGTKIEKVTDPAHRVNNLFNALDLLYNKLNEVNLLGTDNENIGAEQLGLFTSEFITPFQKAQSHIMSQVAEIGGKRKRLELITNKYDQDFINYTQMKSDAEDADEAELIMQFKMAETVYKAALATGNYILQPTLMDYMK
jgi:flagellin-like hook-associated protein FlgL